MFSCPAIFLLLAALDEKILHLLIAGRHFDLLEIDHIHSSLLTPGESKPLR
jgi:hypothetical protein